MSCPSSIYCISNTGVPLYNDSYEDTLTNYNGVQYYTGQTNGLFIYYSSGDTQWCLSDTLGGTCYLSGKSPCSTTCPDLCDELFTTGSCPTPTPTPTNNCSSLDFSALFDCDLPPTPSVTPTSTVTPTVTVTPTSTNICPVSFIDATIYSVSPTPTSTPTMTPTPSMMVERDCTFSGAVTYDMINDDIICPFSYEFQECFGAGRKFYTFDTIENPSGGNIEEFMIFYASVLVGGTSTPENLCIHYIGFNNQVSGTDHITLLNGPYGFANMGQCNLCDNANTPTPTPTPTITPTPSITPTNTVTPTNTPTNTVTPTPTLTVTPTNTPTPTETQPINCLCYTVSYTGPPPFPEPVQGVTNFSYVNCSGDIVIGSVGDGEIAPTSVDVCARQNSIEITGGDELATWEPSIVDCCLDSCVSGQLIIDNNSSGSEITEIYSTPNTWIIATSVPVGPGSIDNGAQGGTNNPISIEIGDFSSLDNPSCLLMYVNSTLIESLSVTSSGTYTFTPYSISNSDCVWFIFNQGDCS